MVPIWYMIIDFTYNTKHKYLIRIKITTNCLIIVTQIVEITEKVTKLFCKFIVYIDNLNLFFRVIIPVNEITVVLKIFLRTVVRK